MSGELEESIKLSIRKNGFPEKAVRLPFKPVFESSKKYGTSLTEVLKNLEAESIFSKIEGNHIEFRSAEKQAQQNSHNEKPSEETTSSPKESENDFNFPGLGGLNMETLQEKAQQQMANMTPEQLSDILKMAENMSDEEKQNILKILTQNFNPTGQGPEQNS